MPTSIILFCYWTDDMTIKSRKLFGWISGTWFHFQPEPNIWYNPSNITLISITFKAIRRESMCIIVNISWEKGKGVILVKYVYFGVIWKLYLLSSAFLLEHILPKMINDPLFKNFMLKNILLVIGLLYFVWAPHFCSR